MKTTQVILGTGGIHSFGYELVTALENYCSSVRLVIRNRVLLNGYSTWFQADLTQPDPVNRAVNGCSVAYLTVGLPYQARVWEEQWPLIMQNVIAACAAHNCKLVFLDNTCLYAQTSVGNITERSAIHPPGRKGKVRLAITRKLARGEKAQWFANANRLHNFTYVPEAARALAKLGNTPEASNQVWHLPTNREPMNGKDWVEHIARKMGGVTGSLFYLPGLLPL